VQHLQQQMAHSAPQHMHRAMHMITDKAISPPTTIPTMTGHLLRVSRRFDPGAGSHELAVALGHAVVP
jgi:hypothetical protein